MICLTGLIGAFTWSRRDTPGYTVLDHDVRYSVSAFKLSRGFDHDLWDADQAEITFSRWLGSTAWTRRFRSKLLSPIPYFRTKSANPSLAFIIRLKGDMLDTELAGLRARVLSGTNAYDLRDQASDRNWIKRSIIKCWRMEKTPPTNAPLELRITFSSGTELARIRISPHQPEFGRPLVPPENRKRYVAEILGSFLSSKTPAEETIMILHGLYEEYDVPDYLTVFEMIYYDHCAPGVEKGRESLNHRLRTEAQRWLRETRLD